MRIREVAHQLRADGADTLIYGNPYETVNGATIITVTRIRGILGITATPLGIFVVHDGAARWEPAFDANRVALFGEFIGLAAVVIATLTVLRRPPWPDLSRPG
ncbi:hypothetical protein BFN03_17505 [Rhodococcus sp. WMMA185]|uniref:hypothetical protein n=1 Tax=Rhodococcus sp. WMMA185 TaxID=679318 RepID=UPI000878E325|nr:hypothetical protein [Rhodococcus sp. WMMA185]AOW93849.1 hypothetical protein BFN03_17505 [Rhodococcus sp. WMMA185]